MMGKSCPKPTSPVEDIALSDRMPVGAIPRDLSPAWLWVLVRSTADPPEDVWVRYQAEHAPEGLDVRPAAPPRAGSTGVAVLRKVPTIITGNGAPEETEAAQPRRKYTPRRTRSAPTDRNLVTVQEFADHVGCSAASIHSLVKLGLPSIKPPGLGRRVLKEQGVAWLIAGGARTSRVALKLAKAAHRAKRSAANGASGGSG